MTYNSTSIEVLEGLEAVRKRPGMYVADQGARGLHQLVWEAVDNAVDEALAGFAQNVWVALITDGCSVEDDGRGIPVDLHATEKKPAVEVVMTTLHAGGKFNTHTYRTAGGLHGVGISAVNALSSHMVTTVWRNGREYTIEFAKGKVAQPLRERRMGSDWIGTGTRQYFIPDATIFESTTFDAKQIRRRLQELAFLNRGLRISFTDEREEEENLEEYLEQDGLAGLARFLNGTRHPLTDVVYTEGEEAGVQVQVAVQWTDSYTELSRSFANNVHTVEGGVHLSAARTTVTRALNAHARGRGLLKVDDPNLGVDDVLEGATLVVSVYLTDPQFEGQTKTKLGNAPVMGIVSRVLGERLGFYFEENPRVARLLVERALTARRARDAANKARDMARRKNTLEGAGLPGKLVDCRSTQPTECEIFLVEGDSAGGTAKGGRDPEFQAILPLRGKILNVEKSTTDKMLDNTEVKMMISALGCGFGASFNRRKLRYHKVIIMTDADVDGSHIRTLLLTFFYRQMPELLYHGHIYIARPPLYGVQRGKKIQYAWDTPGLEALLAATPDSSVQQYKGLGEMDAEQLAATTMEPAGRVLSLVTIDDAVETEGVFTTLMGAAVEPRKQFIQTNARRAQLDL